MRKIVRFMTILLALVFVPASAQTVQSLRFKIVPDGGTHVDGNPSYPGASSSTHSFTVTSDLSEGFTLGVDPYGPTVSNTTGTPYDFQLGIFIDGQWASDLNLGNLGSGSSFATVDVTDLPPGFVADRQIVLSGGYLGGANYIPVTIRWCFDENGANYKEVRGEPVSFTDPGLEYYQPFAFNYQPNALPPILRLDMVDKPYKIYNSSGPVPAGYTDPIAANHGTDLIFNVSSGEGPDLRHCTSTLYFDDDSGMLEENIDISRYTTSQGPPAESELKFRLDDPGLESESLYFLRVEVTNVFNLSTVLIVPITSFRALDWPESVTWDLELQDSGGGSCTYQDFLTNPATTSFQTVHYAHVPPCNNPGDAHDLIVTLEKYRDAYGEKTYEAALEMDFNVSLLVSERDGCTPMTRFAKTPGSGGVGIFQFLDLENSGSNAEYVWAMAEAQPTYYPDGDYVELAVVEMVDQRSGKNLTVENLDISGGGDLGNSWPYNWPKHCLRLVSDSGSGSANCQSFDFSFYAASCATEISELEYTSGQNLAFSVKASLPASPFYDHHISVVDNYGPVAFTVVHDEMPANPASGACYPFQIQIDQPVSNNFTIKFQLENADHIVVARELHVNLTTPAEPIIDRIAYEKGAFSVTSDGIVDFYFVVEYDWSAPDKVNWRWHDSNGQEHWLESGEWSPNLGDPAEVGGSGSFSGHWQDTPVATGQKIEWPNGDFAPYIENFFGGLSSQSITLEVELIFGNQTASYTSDPFEITLEPTPSSLESASVGYVDVAGEYQTLTYDAEEEDQLRFFLAPAQGETLDINQVQFSIAGGARVLVYNPADPNFTSIDQSAPTLVLAGPTGALSGLASEGTHELQFFANQFAVTGFGVTLHAINGIRLSTGKRSAESRSGGTY